MELAAPTAVNISSLARRACPCRGTASHPGALGWKRNRSRGRILVSANCPSSMKRFARLMVLPPEQSPGCRSHHGQPHPNFSAPLKFNFTSRTSLYPHYTTTALSYREVRVVRTGFSTGHRSHFPHLPHHTFEGADGCQSRWGQLAFRRSQRERRGHLPSGVQPPEHHFCATSAGLP